MARRIINFIVVSALCIYIALVVLFHIPYIQGFLGRSVGDVLSKMFGTEVSVGRVDLGFINRLIIDDISMLDHQGQQMLKVSRASVKIDFVPLFQGKISITSSQFFGLKALLYKQTAKSEPNFQFVLDSLKSDKKEKPGNIDLKINSIIIRNGAVRFYVADKLRKSSPSSFSPDNLYATAISGHFMLNKFANDSLNLKIKKLSFKERSGLDVRSLSLEFSANRRNANLAYLRLKLPESSVAINNLRASYRFDDGKFSLETLKYSGQVDAPHLSLGDLSWIAPNLSRAGVDLAFSSTFSGHGRSLNVKRLDFHSSDRSLSLQANGMASNVGSGGYWEVKKLRLNVSNSFIKHLSDANIVKLPAIASNLGNISILGSGKGFGRSLSAKVHAITGVGGIDIDIDKSRFSLSGHVSTHGFDLGKAVSNDDFGNIAAFVDVSGRSFSDFRLSGNVADFDYKHYRYANVSLDGALKGKAVNGQLAIDDPNIQIGLSGLVDMSGNLPLANLKIEAKHIAPEALNLTSRWGAAHFAFLADISVEGSNLSNLSGSADVSGLDMSSPADGDYRVENISIRSSFEGRQRHLKLESDFCNAEVNGIFDYSSIPSSVVSFIKSKLPTLPQLPNPQRFDKNRFTVDAVVSDSKWLQMFFGLPLQSRAPITLNGHVDDFSHDIDLCVEAPDFAYGSSSYKDASLKIKTNNDTLSLAGSLTKLLDDNKYFALGVNAAAHANHLKTTLRFKNNERHALDGVVNATARFMEDGEGRPTAYVDVEPSAISIDNTAWNVMPSKITYRKNNLHVSDFIVKHGGQYITVDGRATRDASDSVEVDFKDIDLAYILNLVNFHSVEFGGHASGKACLAGAFSSSPKASASIQVPDFLFEKGRMGVLSAKAGFDNANGRIDIDAVANDSNACFTFINGYVSPKDNELRLDFDAQNTRLDFLNSFCGNFMHGIDARANGKIVLSGKLNDLNLTGLMRASGTATVTSLNTTYRFDDAPVNFVPDQIQFGGDTLYDRNGNIGILSGSLHHRHLTNLSYDLDIQARNLLAYDTHAFNGNTFYGTVFATGDCQLKGKSGRLDIDVNATPEKGSVLVYNVGGRSDVFESDFIKWSSRDSVASTDVQDIAAARRDSSDMGYNMNSDMYLNFLINATPDATIKLIMDDRTGDYISLNGTGGLRANYYNKGAFNLFGNYAISEGVYKITIQNLIKKEFNFLDGSAISFNGDPFASALDLKAQYVLNGVSLSDLNIGNSFSNNIRVNCLMNITGTPNSPKVSFGLDMPTLSNDVKQMVYSVINAEEEMNQQVLYLLAVGRFYAQGQNNAAFEGAAQDRQTSLAMQSILSGTISQQINSLLSNVVNSNTWNFGANISTGAEGFNDAEYEGLLSGRLLNNRLLLNGQFGYRDNANATTSFIGDFDLRYLIFPNGNLSISVYNKTNDRYFTRNSLNTQGIGIVLKKDFTNFNDLFGWKRRRAEKKK